MTWQVRYRECIKQLKHLGVVCKTLHIADSGCPWPVRSFCFHTEAVRSDDPILMSLAACDGAMTRQPWIEPEADFSRRRLPAYQGMQAYRHDFDLPRKDWTPVSEELTTVMKERLSHVWEMDRADRGLDLKVVSEAWCLSAWVDVTKSCLPQDSLGCSILCGAQNSQCL